MGGRGSFDWNTLSIPLENREFKKIGSYGNIKIIMGIHDKNGKTPVMSNSPDSIYAVWSETAGRIKHIFIYKDHILNMAIDLEGNKSHWHRVFLDPETGAIGRGTHDKGNTFEPTAEMWDAIKYLSSWKKN